MFDHAGNIFGTTEAGGFGGCGSVFELSPKAGGGWIEQQLQGVCPFNPDAGVTLDRAGNIFGDGLSGLLGTYEYGTAFEVSPKAGGGWSEHIVHNFDNNGTDGWGLTSTMIMDAAGNLYGTTGSGGPYEQGTVFELSPKTGGGWTEEILHDFNDVNYNGTDGMAPADSLVFDKAGNLYGTTYAGGAHNQGTVFELSPAGDGTWTESILYSFNDDGIDGTSPEAGLTLDAAGNLYGTTSLGGTGSNCSFTGCGTVYQLSRTSGTWTERVLHNFDDNGTDGYIAGNYLGVTLVFGAGGKLYGTTPQGGAYAAGIAFQLKPTTGGSWVETVLHSFGNGTDGKGPVGGLIVDASGNLYGATGGGGVHNGGAVFEIKP